MIGGQFGYLTVISKAPSKVFKGGTHSMWNCICVCGKPYVAYGTTLRKSKTISCGCYKQQKMRKPKGEAGFNDLFNEHKKFCRKKNRESTLTKEQFKKLNQDNCAYCGEVPKNVHIAHHGRSKEHIEHEKYVYNGIDRVDSSKGYIEGNCVTCCKLCNIAKHNLNVEEFYNRIVRIYNYMTEKRNKNESIK
jgi:hypothetical protein